MGPVEASRLISSIRKLADEWGGVMVAVLRSAGKMGAVIVPVSQLARLGFPAFAALVCLVAFLTAAVLKWASWVLNDEDRSRRLAQLLSTLLGQPR